MLFDEVFSHSFRATGKILNAAIEKGYISYRQIQKIAKEELPSLDLKREYVETLLDSRDFLSPVDDSCQNYVPVMKHPYERRMTTIEKGWIRTVLDNPRVKLFIDENDIPEELKQIEPLFSWNDILYYDQFSDGDDFNGPKYVENFRLILKAIKQKCFIRVKHGNATFKCFPRKLEYSQKDDKFRLLNSGIGNDHKVGYLRLSKIEFVEILEFNEEFDCDHYNKELEKKTVTVLVSEENNAKERFLLHFSPFQRETIRYNDNTWKVKLSYDGDMESAMINEIMSFGNFVKVIEPEDFRLEIRERLKKQSLEF